MRQLAGPAMLLAVSVSAIGGGEPYCFSRLWFAGSGPDVVAGDLNNDGFPDLVSSSGLIAFNAGFEEGWFLPPIVILGLGGENDVGIGDIDGDGDNDIVSAIGVALINLDGQGLFGGVPLGFSASNTSIKLCDLDDDGDVDIAFAGGSSGLARNNGAGWFGDLAVISGADDSRDLDVADFNSDGFPDIAFVKEDAILVALNDGGGIFSLTEFPAALPGNAPALVAIRAAYFDSTPGIDLLVAHNFDSRNVWLFSGNGGGAFLPQVSVYTAVDGISTLVVGDFNADGTDDVLVSQVDPKFLLSTSGTHVVVQLDTDGNPTGGVGADVNLDGAEDIVLVTGSRFVRFLNEFRCPADFNADCSVNFSDVTEFLVAFETTQDEADFALPMGVWDFSDVVAFLVAFGSGCP